MSNETLLSMTAPLRQLGNGLLFTLRAFSHMQMSVRALRLVARQVHVIGSRSLIIIMTAGFFVGMVLALQTYNTLETFGATEAVGVALTLSLFRELGPVLTGLLFAGRAGTSIAAEIGLMRATEQIDALELMAIDPLERIVQPRLLGGIISVPILTVMFNLLALLGGFLFACGLMGMDVGTFWGNIQSSVELTEDLMHGTIKSVVFGFVASIVAVYYGYTATPTGEGVSTATTQTVIVTAIAILMLDFVLTALMFG